MTTNGIDWKEGMEVRVAGQGWCDAPGVIQQIAERGFYAYVVGKGREAWIPLTSLKLK